MQFTELFHHRDHTFHGPFGMDQYDLTHLFRFIGAENNKMLILEDRNDVEKTLGEVVQSRFQFSWY